ncbi:hypothetical protein CLOM_g3350 [Closterium sp. NIES-68]|nr:hypothetical protein CLOM_g3350 [Closterium sp. NIES-68]GJP81627.1 hypothetical protein CLOP_g11784 [Closterium sp. NIES-67]
MVRQFRPTVLAAVAAATGADIRGGEEGVQLTGDLDAAFTYELCAGLVDKPGKDLRQIAKEEIAEETGYDVPLDSLQVVTAALTSVGISGAKQTLFYAQVNEGQRIHAGGGKEDEGEAIDVVGLPLSQLDAFIADVDLPKSPGGLFGVAWFKATVLPTLKNKN